MTQITLPYPPSANTYYRTFRGRMLISKEGRQYKEAVGTMALLSRLAKVEGKVEVELYVTPPDRRRRDLGNVEKCLVDSIKDILFGDDSEIDRLTLVRLPVRAPGSVLVRIRPAGAQEVPSDE